MGSVGLIILFQLVKDACIKQTFMQASFVSYFICHRYFLLQVYFGVLGFSLTS